MLKDRRVYGEGELELAPTPFSTGELRGWQPGAVGDVLGGAAAGLLDTLFFFCWALGEVQADLAELAQYPTKGRGLTKDFH